MNTASSEVLDVDPQLSERYGGAAIADLAFGSMSHAQDSLAGRPLAMLTPETLELDLSDPAQRLFGDYELLELIGEGGMGVVYRARQISLDREVAVKLLAAGPWASREFVERFRHEAQNAARMQHPNIVSIYEIGSAEELHFFSMRLVRGSSLAATIKDTGPMPPQRAAALMRTVAEAVDYAHSLGVLHLDLNPANVLLEEDGTPHVADFGLARRLERGLATDNEEISGTPSYMAPEQATVGSQQITAGTDIWGLGAILYELVTGEPPYTAATPQATLKLVTEGSLRSPRRYMPRLSRDLEAIILKCMHRDAGARYASARALADDLGRFIEGRIVQARPLGSAQRVWRWSRRQPLIATLGLLFALSLIAGIIGIASQWRRAEGNAHRAVANADMARERLWEARREAALRSQLDGRGFEALPGLLANIQDQERAGKSTLAGIERHEIGAILSQGVTLIDRMIIADAIPLAAELSPDGKLLAIGLNDQTVRWYDTRSMTESGRVDLAGLPTSLDEITLPRVLRFVDNRRLRVTLDWLDVLMNPDDDDTYLIDLATAKVVDAPREFIDLTNADYSADGRYALLHDQRQGIQLWQLDPWRALSPKLPFAAHNRNGHDPGGWVVGRGARYVAKIALSLDMLDFYYPPQLSGPLPVALPRNVRLNAWAENNNGSRLALGDTQGRVFLLDTMTRRLRQLPTSLGRQVTWLTFSEDDRWLAAVRADGVALAFDVVSGEQLTSNQMQQDFVLTQVALSHRDRLLIASGAGDNGPGQTVVWRLPAPGLSSDEATRLLSNPNSTAGDGFSAVGVAMRAGLLATAPMDGEIRLWRLPPAPILPARAPPLLASHLYFDGQHIVDVDYAKLRIVSPTGVGLTPWAALPQPVGFAVLVDAGRTLIVTCGSELRVYDARTVALRYPPVQLPDTPMHLDADMQGHAVVLGFGGNTSVDFVERIGVYDLKTGLRHPGTAIVKGPLRQLEFSGDGSQVLATGPINGATEVFDSGNLHRTARYRHDPDAPVKRASFAAASGPARKQLFIATSTADESGIGGDFLLRWDPFRGLLSQRKMSYSKNSPVGLIAVAGKPFVVGRKWDVSDPGAADERGVPPLARSEPTAALAASHDGFLIAHAFRHEVQLYDAAMNLPVGPPLSGGLSPEDSIASIAFASDDQHLLARTLQGHWLLWATGADRRPLADIRADMTLLDPAPATSHVLQLPGRSERNRLHARDPGVPAAPASTAHGSVARMIGGAAIPARDAGASPLLLDLTAYYTLAPDSEFNFFSHTFADMPGFPLGIVHLDGTDYDLRGAVELHPSRPGRRAQNEMLPSRAMGIHTPHIPIAAFRALLFVGIGTPQPDETACADIRVHYVNGSTAVIPIRTQRDVPGWSDRDRPTPFAWVPADQHLLLGDQLQRMISSPRLPNPHPELPVASIDLESVNLYPVVMEPVFFAITAEPVIANVHPGINRQSPMN